MKYRIHFAQILALAFAVCMFNEVGAMSLWIQQGPGRGPITVARDPEIEKQSSHNLDVAKYYFYKRKPDKKDKEGWDRLNKAIESRLTEIIDINPTFAQMADVYFLLGELYKRTGDLDKAVENWTKVVKEFPDSELKVEAQKRLDEAKNQTNTQSKEKKG